MKTNAIYCGDAQRVLGNTLEFPDKSVDLVYVDPPFYSAETYEVIWEDGYERRAFEDRWKGGIENYISWMDPKLRECHRVLKDSGSLYLHCDWHAGAYLKVLLDRIFGYNRFQREVIWKLGWVSGFKSKAKNYIRNHETLLFYTKSDDFTFNKVYVPHPKGYTRRGGGENPKGVALDDVWTDIYSIQHLSFSKEKLGYPTQKPVELLKRIVQVSSNPDDVVLDPMCGCGTAIAAAYELKRKWVGIDISPTACKLMAKRMRSLGAQVGQDDIVGLPRTEVQIREMQPFEFQNWVFQQIQGRVSPQLRGDKGIDGRMFDLTPVQVKQSESVGRNVVDNFRAAIQRDKKTKGMIVALSFGSGAYEEVARLKNEDGIEITLKTLKELLEDD